jgi:hypothetical protein
VGVSAGLAAGAMESMVHAPPDPAAIPAEQTAADRRRRFADALATMFPEERAGDAAEVPGRSSEPGGSAAVAAADAGGSLLPREYSTINRCAIALRNTGKPNPHSENLDDRNGCWEIGGLQTGTQVADMHHGRLSAMQIDRQRSICEAADGRPTGRKSIEALVADDWGPGTSLFSKAPLGTSKCRALVADGKRHQSIGRRSRQVRR